jgi:hypothetical protein
MKIVPEIYEITNNNGVQKPLIKTGLPRTGIKCGGVTKKPNE